MSDKTKTSPIGTKDPEEARRVFQASVDGVRWSAFGIGNSTGIGGIALAGALFTSVYFHWNLRQTGEIVAAVAVAYALVGVGKEFCDRYRRFSRAATTWLYPVWESWAESEASRQALIHSLEETRRDADMLKDQLGRLQGVKDDYQQLFANYNKLISIESLLVMKLASKLTDTDHQSVRFEQSAGDDAE